MSNTWKIAVVLALECGRRRPALKATGNNGNESMRGQGTPWFRNKLEKINQGGTSARLGHVLVSKFYEQVYCSRWWGRLQENMKSTQPGSKSLSPTSLFQTLLVPLSQDLWGQDVRWRGSSLVPAPARASTRRRPCCCPPCWCTRYPQCSNLLPSSNVRSDRQSRTPGKLKDETKFCSIIVQLTSILPSSLKSKNWLKK